MLKKLLVIGGGVLLLTVAFAAVAFANAGPHGGYSITTDACAGCHRAHTAIGKDYLLVKENQYALCTSCHNGTAVATDVLHGTYAGGASILAGGTDQARLNGGGFESMGGVAATSAHNVDGLGGGNGVGTAWGSANAGEGAVGVLECGSCHNPHGSTNYRILNDSSTWAYTSGSVGATINANAFRQYEVMEVPGGSTYTDGNISNFTSGMGDFCASCHRSYLVRGGRSTASTSTQLRSDGTPIYWYPGTQDANDGAGDIPRYRHTTSRSYGTGYTTGPYIGRGGSPIRFGAMTATSNTNKRDSFNCLTCHFAHGTTATATGFAANVAPTNDSALLYYDGRGICWDCHTPEVPSGH